MPQCCIFLALIQAPFPISFLEAFFTLADLFPTWRVPAVDVPVDAFCFEIDKLVKHSPIPLYAGRRRATGRVVVMYYLIPQSPRKLTS
jgi:hypothetical protein